ncbi:MAG: hypothetical protein COY40_03035 [Alphaproteobacteria bacterium CG_4_10_14_0_8_um_filter_53_9]|nr:MAG: hypothetical protein COY40_03035 [Alphaproteobacteria bacterium CG_4_10_14_0_8_um_filter_53_9]
MRMIRRHIIHCSDSLTGDVKDVRRWHKERGWRDVGYHFVIRPDGEIEVGRMMSEMGAHCYGHNADSLGTCLIGRDVFSEAQFEALRRLHDSLSRMFPGLELYGHRDFNPGKTCPNFNVREKVTEWPG